MDEILKCDLQIKATQQYFPVVLFIMLYKVVLTFESVDEILSMAFCGAVPFSIFCGTKFEQ